MAEKGFLRISDWFAPGCLGQKAALAQHRRQTVSWHPSPDRSDPPAFLAGCEPEPTRLACPELKIRITRLAAVTQTRRRCSLLFCRIQGQGINQHSNICSQLHVTVLLKSKKKDVCIIMSHELDLSQTRSRLFSEFLVCLKTDEEMRNNSTMNGFMNKLHWWMK